MSNFNTDIRFLKGVGEKRATHLYHLGIDTIGALLRFYPRGYKDLGVITPIFDCNVGEKVCIKATICTPINEHYIRKNMTIYKFSVRDESGLINVTMFNCKYTVKQLRTGRQYLFYGKIEASGYSLSMQNPEISEVGAAGIHPVYPASEKISSKQIEKLIKTALTLPPENDPLPLSLREKYKLQDLESALSNIHFPKSDVALLGAKRRFVFEELFILQLGLMLLKGKRKIATENIINKNFIGEFSSLLPYKLTAAQERAYNDCFSDISSGKIMNRLIQGDVGSGKTAVAAALMYTLSKNGFQSALMAPTEILAEQHFKTICEILEDSGIKCCLLTGSVSKSKKDKIKEGLKSGEYHIAIGTHALLTDDTEFNKLGLVITDEQHRFGVAQRAKLSSKGHGVHTLVMSATPIPRTLGLIIYGDLDITIIDEYPRGRQAVDSYLVTSELRPRVFNFIKKHLNEGRQGYIVCPLVEENEELGLLSAEEYYEKIAKKEFPEYNVGLLHGKMNAKDKDRVMRAFKDKEIDLLICTTVIEVGIDVPNAAIMVIENAERFGLSQLHQLRGRIGRGKHKSSCIFISDIKGSATKERLQVITKNSDGFKIADEDLRLRGPGDFLGNRQHGLPNLKIADLFADSDTLRLAGMAAANILENDPRLKQEENLPLREEIIALYKQLNEN